MMNGRLLIRISPADDFVAREGLRGAQYSDQRDSAASKALK
jgi:hypothetical protein